MQQQHLRRIPFILSFSCFFGGIPAGNLSGDQFRGEDLRFFTPKRERSNTSGGFLEFGVEFFVLGEFQAIMKWTFYLLLLIFSVSFTATQSQNTGGNDPGMAFRPSIAVIIGVLSIMFTLTFLLLLYAKFCQVSVGASDFFNGDERTVIPTMMRSRFSGVDKKLIESLPFFKFSALKGSKDGLECAVCLSKFEETEILRLLPKCKHAFHINCIDRWLECHSSCPLCRSKVEAHDVSVFLISNTSARITRNPSDLTDDGNVELFIRREIDGEPSSSSSRFGIVGSFRKIMEKPSQIDEIAPADLDISTDRELLHKFKHRIVVSDVVYKHRWSDVNSSDLLFLNSEVLNAISSKRFSSVESGSERLFPAIAPSETGSTSGERIIQIKEEMEKKRLLELKASKFKEVNFPSAAEIDSRFLIENKDEQRFLTSSGKRSMSEITNFPRFPEFGLIKMRNKEMNSETMKEDRTRRLWFPIARRTVQWFTGREKRSSQTPFQNTPRGEFIDV